MVNGYVMIVRIPESADENIFRLAEEEPPGDSTRTDDGGTERYGDLYYQYSTTSGGLNWVRINSTADNGFFYYRVPTSRIRGDGQLYIQKFERLTVDTTKVDSGYENWAERGNTDEIPASKLPSNISQHAQELVNQQRGISIASASTAVRTHLTTFTRSLTLGTTDHGVFFTAIQASISNGTIALDNTMVSVSNLDYMSALRSSTAYDDSAGAVGNGLLIGSFDVNNSSGVKQGTVNLYIARNAANQVGTYNSYVPESGASSSLTGQISIIWEVSLLLTDSSTGSSFTQAQIEEFARDAIATAITAGNGDVTAVNHDQQNQIILSIKAGSISVTDIQRDTTDATKALNLSTWQTLFGIEDNSIDSSGSNDTAGSVASISVDVALYNTYIFGQADLRADMDRLVENGLISITAYLRIRGGRMSSGTISGSAVGIVVLPVNSSGSVITTAIGSNVGRGTSHAWSSTGQTFQYSLTTFAKVGSTTRYAFGVFSHTSLGRIPGNTLYYSSAVFGFFPKPIP